MRVGVLGGTGFLGNYVVKGLIEKKHKPIIISRKKRIENDFIVTDYSKEDMLEKFTNIDSIIYLAAKRSSTGNISEFHENEVLTQNLYDVCAKLNIRNIVYASTISVYSKRDELPWNEESTIQPSLMYGISKYSCELIGNIYNDKKELNIKNLRLAHLFGFNEKNNYMINKFMRQAFNKQELILDIKGNAKREFLYAKDASKAIILALENKNLKGTYNIGSEEKFTNYEVALMINDTFNNESGVVVKSESNFDNIESSYMSSCKAREEFGFKCDYTFKSALNEIYEQMGSLVDVPIIY